LIPCKVALFRPNQKKYWKKAPRPRSNRTRGGISPLLPAKGGFTSWFLGGGPGVPTVKVLYYNEIFILIKKTPADAEAFLVIEILSSNYESYKNKVYY